MFHSFSAFVLQWRVLCSFPAVRTLRMVITHNRTHAFQISLRRFITRRGTLLKVANDQDRKIIMIVSCQARQCRLHGVVISSRYDLESYFNFFGLILSCCPLQFLGYQKPKCALRAHFGFGTLDPVYARLYGVNVRVFTSSSLVKLCV